MTAIEALGDDRSAGDADRAPLEVVVVNGSPSRKSKTAGLTDLMVDRVTAALARAGLAARTTTVDVYRLGPAFTGAVEREGIAADIDDLLRQVENADLLIAATPVFRGSYTGMFKHLFDLVDQYALANKPVLLAATGGGEHHALVLEHAMRPLFSFFQAMTAPVAVFASATDFDGTIPLTPRIHGRIETAIDDILPLLVARAGKRGPLPVARPQVEEAASA
ncbi:NAD(P)H-dependent oxidoreductase [Microbacterium sp. MAHUQ-60]|uniref:NAD(P)H-dependent oxidoreductase n=1 Tax=unclassified Microbacterium TaxID=2609290 RepID=UPI00361B38C8